MEIEKIKAEYTKLSELIEEFLTEVVTQIKHGIKGDGLKLVFPVDGRIKRLDSVIDKIKEKKFIPKESITEMQDLVGLRLVTLYKDEIPNIARMIEKMFPNPKRYDTKHKNGSDHFGYSSLHFIISPPITWENVQHLSRFSGLIGEIQIRTLSEHIWAECSHSLYYKSNVNVPPNINRPLHRLSALLEIVDSELEQIKSAHHKYKESVERLEIKELLMEDLNVLTFQKLLMVMLPNFEPLTEEQYALLDKTVEKEFNIESLPFLFEIINRYHKEIPKDGLSQKAVLEIILEKFKENGYR